MGDLGGPTSQLTSPSFRKGGYPIEKSTQNKFKTNKQVNNVAFSVLNQIRIIQSILSHFLGNCHKLSFLFLLEAVMENFVKS